MPMWSCRADMPVASLRLAIPTYGSSGASAWTRPTCPSVRRTLMPCGWLAEEVRMSWTTPMTRRPVTWSCLRTIATRNPWPRASADNHTSSTQSVCCPQTHSGSHEDTARRQRYCSIAHTPDPLQRWSHHRRLRGWWCSGTWYVGCPQLSPTIPRLSPATALINPCASGRLVATKGRRTT